MGHPRNVEDMLSEISGYVSYIEDLSKSDKSKRAACKEKIKKIENRLSGLVQLGSLRGKVAEDMTGIIEGRCFSRSSGWPYSETRSTRPTWCLEHTSSPGA